MNSNAMLMGMIISGDTIQLKGLTDGTGANLDNYTVLTVTDKRIKMFTHKSKKKSK